MNSYERVKRAIEFKKPDRIPLSFFFRLDEDDTVQSGYKTLEPISFLEAKKKGLEKYTDEWGVPWVLNPEGSNIDNMGYVQDNPIKDYSQLEEYPFPDPDDPKRYEDISSTLKQNEGKYILNGWFTLFERTWQLRGMSNTFTDMYDNPESFEKLLNKITDFSVLTINNLSDFKGIHGFHMGDDWGTQSGLFINLKQFRHFFKPHYKKMIDAAHKHGMHVWLHSDGKINDLIEDFIDIGLDVINIEQPLLVGIDEISRRYQGKIAFQPIVDIQKTLVNGSPKEIEKQVKEIIQKWGTPQGGIIAMDYWDYEAIGIDKNRARLALEAWKKYGRY